MTHFKHNTHTYTQSVYKIYPYPLYFENGLFEIFKFWGCSGVLPWGRQLSNLLRRIASRNDRFISQVFIILNYRVGTDFIDILHTHVRTRARAHTHTNIYICIYIYSVCVFSIEIDINYKEKLFTFAIFLHFSKERLNILYLLNLYLLLHFYFYLFLRLTFLLWYTISFV